MSAFAVAGIERPALIVESPYLWALQTAAVTIARFPLCPARCGRLNGKAGNIAALRKGSFAQLKSSNAPTATFCDNLLPIETLVS